MRKFLLVSIYYMPEAKKPTCKLLGQLYSKDPSFKPQTRQCIDASCKNVKAGVQIVEVCKTVRLPAQNATTANRISVDYVKTLDIPVSCATAPMIKLIQLGVKEVSAAVIFNICRLGAAGLVAGDSSYWLELYLELYKKSKNREELLTSEQSGALVAACIAWFESQIFGNFVPGEDLTEELESRLKKLDPHPVYWIKTCGRTVTTGDTVVAFTPDFVEHVVDAVAVLNGRSGTFGNVKSTFRRSGKDIFYTILPDPDVKSLRTSAKLMLNAAVLANQDYTKPRIE